MNAYKNQVAMQSSAFQPHSDIYFPWLNKVRCWGFCFEVSSQVFRERVHSRKVQALVFGLKSGSTPRVELKITPTAAVVHLFASLGQRKKLQTKYW